jgi:hypothetical protein
VSKTGNLAKKLSASWGSGAFGSWKPINAPTVITFRLNQNLLYFSYKLEIMLIYLIKEILKLTF